MDIHVKRVDAKGGEGSLAAKEFLDLYGRVFQKWEFISAVSTDPEFLVASNSDVVLGVLSLVTTRKYGVKGYHIPPYGHINDIVINDQYEKNRGNIISAILSKLSGFRLLELKSDIYNGDLLPYTQAGASVMATQTHIINFNEEYGPADIHSSKRRYLKKLLKALDDGEIKLIQGDNAIARIIELQNLTAKNRGFRSHEDHLERIVQSLRNDQAFCIVLTDREGLSLAGAYCPYDSSFAYHLINASVKQEDGILKYANILSTYLAVRKAMNMGLSFDFEGSNVPGVAKFYRMMGGEPHLIHRIQLPGSMIGRMWFAYKQWIIS